jgi:prepilin-type N-terminal cleavage/methylation domain-containing protein
MIREKKMTINRKEDNKRISRRASGITLIELLITIAVFAIIAGIAYPMFQRIAINNNLKTAARDLASDFANMKERSIAEYRMHRITLNLGANTYTLQECANQGAPCNGWNPMFVKNLGDVASDIVFDAGNTNQVDFFFQGRGTMTPMGTIGLTNSRNSTARITINITGRSSVQFNLQ